MSSTPGADGVPREAGVPEAELSLIDVLVPLLESWKLLILGPLLVGLVALGATYFMKPVFVSRVLFMPPQQTQSAAASALSSLGSLAGLAGGGSVKNPAEQFVALLQSTTVADRMIDRFDLMAVYQVELRSDARRVLGSNTQIAVGKKDGLILVDVLDQEPQRAANMANRYVEELRMLSSSMALTEAQHRRQFFESQVNATKQRLDRAQVALQASGFNPGALRSEPQATAEAYAALQAKVGAAEVRLQVLRRNLTETAPEVQQQSATLNALRQQLSRAERPAAITQSEDYVGRFRDFKYEEALFEFFSRQYETAKVDESREGALIQVVDPATPADRRTSPKRALTAIIASLVAGFVLLIFVLVREAWRRTTASEADSPGLKRLRIAMGRGDSHEQ